MKQTIQLQSVGHVPAIVASEMKIGDVRMYNFGSTSLIIHISEKTVKTLQVIEYCKQYDEYYVYNIRKSTLVAIVKSEQDVSEHKPQQAKSKGNLVDVSEYFPLVEVQPQEESQPEQTEITVTIDENGFIVLSNEQARELDMKFVHNKATAQEEKLLGDYHLQLQERAMSFHKTLHSNYEKLINDDKVYNIVSTFGNEHSSAGIYEIEVTGKELKFPLLWRKAEVLNIITSLEEQPINEITEIEEQETNNNEEELLMEKQYVLNRETGKLELHFSKEEYKALSEEQKSLLKCHFLFSGSRSAWVSRSKNNHYSAIETAEKLGFSNGGKIGERLSFTEGLERQTEKAEARAERFEEYAENAERRATSLQSEFNEYRKDWSWLTQPIIAGHSGSQIFKRHKDRVMAKYEKGFDEYRKSAYFKERAETARMTADQSKLKNRTYLSNRIEECQKELKRLQDSIVIAEERNNEERLNDYLEQYEYEMDKLAYFENCMDEIGGVKYNKDNLKPGYLVKIRGSWEVVVKANPKTVEAQSSVVPYTLKYSYAEIQDMQIPEGWQEPKNTIENPFQVGDIVHCTNIGGNRIIHAFQVIKKTNKTVTIQEIKVENNVPVKDEFISDEQERKTVRKDRSGNFILDYWSWILYPYKNEEQQAI